MTEKTQMKIAFIGLGRMGGPMAGHLAAAGHNVTVVEPDIDTLTRWCQTHEGDAAPSAGAAASDAEVVITSLPADEQLQTVAEGPEGILDNLPSGGVWVDHTTASVQISRTLAVDADTRDLGFIDAPVSGGVDGATRGSLAIMAGGTTIDVDRVRPLLECYAKRISHMGDAGTGQLTKMTNQICVVGIGQALAEGLDFAETAGLDLEKVVEVMLSGASASWQMDNRWQAMANSDYEFGFATELMRKDIGLCLAEARRSGVGLPVTALVDQFLSDVEALGGKRWDWCSLMERQRGARRG
tara:strand:- start:5 stop:898 length:894 start_codon:yes stop_codon:yes gene_type:complete